MSVGAEFLSSPPGGASALPVFVFPSSLYFYSNEPSGHKQLLTLYNPYEFALNYKVLSTSPQKYSVVEPEGSLRPRCCIDIVIRHLVPNLKSNIGTSDKFRIHVQKIGSKEIVGKKDVTATLYANKQETSDDSQRFQGISSSTRSHTPTQPIQYTFPPDYRPLGSTDPSSSPGQSIIVYLSALLCVIALTLPTSGDVIGSTLPVPDWLHLSVPQKLVAAYVLGLITMLLIRP